MPRKIEISHRTIIFIFAFLAGIWFVAQIRDILFLLFISFILMTAIRPMVEWLEQYRVPRAISVFTVYILIFGFFGVSFAGAVPTLVTQSGRLMTELPRLVARVFPQWNGDISIITQQLAPLSENVIRVSVNIFNNALSTVTVLVFTFYLLTGRRDAERFLAETLGPEVSRRVKEIVKRIEDRLGAWVRGQLLLMLIVGVFSYIGLLILRVEYALPLAIIAGVLEILPMIGPIISGVPAVLVALTVSPFLAVSVAALYFLIQQVENSVIVPQVMKKSVGFSPLLTIVALMIGARLAGVTGAVLAIPIVVTAQVIISYFLFDSDTKKPRE